MDFWGSCRLWTRLIIELLILVCSRSSAANCKEKTFAKRMYLKENAIKISSIKRETNKTL